jgi:hypothetical protein
VVKDGFWTRRAFDGLLAAAEALFPKNAIGAPDFAETRLLDRSIEYLAILPPPQRRLLILLFILVEIALPLLTLRGIGRYSKLPVERRLWLIRELRRSKLYPLRLIGDAVKGMLTMMYMSHPEVIRHIGMF